MLLNNFFLLHLLYFPLNVAVQVYCLGHFDFGPVFADTFKFLSKMGFEIQVEALHFVHEYWARRHEKKLQICGLIEEVRLNFEFAHSFLRVVKLVLFECLAVFVVSFRCEKP